MSQEFPQSVKACLWSYNTDMIDISLPDHRIRIIHNVLDRGTNEAIDWLRANFEDIEIAKTISQTSSSDWSKKSLALWSLVFKTYPLRKDRFI